MLSDDPTEFTRCNERYGELCALSVTEALRPEESLELRTHLTTCVRCTALLVEYQALISQDMAGIGAILFDAGKMIETVPEWSRSDAKKAILAHGSQKRSVHRRAPTPPALLKRHVALRAAAIAAIFFMVATLSYLVGRQRLARKGRGTEQSSTSAAQLSNASGSNRSRLTGSLGVEQNSTEAIAKDVRQPIQPPLSSSGADQKKLSDLQTKERALEKTLEQLGREKATEQERVAALSSEKTVLQLQLEQTRTQVQNLTLDLDRVKQESDRDSLRNAAKEAEVNSLREHLRQAEKENDQTAQFLASDRDIRELMGARQLYIADVFDVNQEGKSKAYGRIFYTKGKSLIFYAFDLDQQPEVRDAKSFQAWGRSDTTRSRPVSLGIFYLDNSANRRWVLKSDNPDVLEQINSVFVTVEPPGGSKKPSSRPLLLAYLRSLPPNHP
jgi:Anti-sigma-K factor rskA